ncbi:MAG: RNA ligase family protein [Myxococcaceae bacterium]
MDHQPYPKIAQRVPDDLTAGTWVATEKLHGAHLVLGFDGARVSFGKRKAWLTADEPFFGWQLLRATLESAITTTWKLLGTASAIRVHGELIGGEYPHPAVPRVPGVSAVQTGCWYDPGLRFVAFDLVLESPTPTFLAFHELEALGRFELPPVLGRGSRATLLQLPVEFPSRLATARGLPAVPGNLAEGLVLKPDTRWAVADRPTLKRKHPRFDDAKYDESSAWSPRASLTEAEWRQLAAILVNPARVSSARSKVGDDAARIADEVVLDVLLDLEAFQPRAFALADPEVLSALTLEALQALG